MGSELRSSGSVALTSAAPHEGNISTSHVYTDYFVINASGKTSITSEISTLISDKLEGCGRVDLVSMSVKIMPTADKQSFYIGTCSTSNSATAKTLAGSKAGFGRVSNAFNVGTEMLFDLVPMDTLSRQIRPCSAMLPMMQIKMEKTKELPMWITLEVLVHGVRTHYIDLN